MRKNKSQTFNDSIYTDRLNLFKILYFINGELVRDKEERVKIKNIAIFEQFDQKSAAGTICSKRRLWNNMIQKAPLDQLLSKGALGTICPQRRLWNNLIQKAPPEQFVPKAAFGTL